jgi:hypothetical protein
MKQRGAGEKLSSYGRLLKKVQVQGGARKAE